MGDVEFYVSLLGLNADYAAALDGRDYARWPDFFTEDCIYRVQARENFDRNLPLALLAFESRGMLLDRIYGITETLFHDPYYQRHVIGPPRIIERGAGWVRAETNYAVFRTKQNELSEVFNVGRYIDRVVVAGGGLKLAERLCIYDSEMIPNSLIYPI